MPKPETGAIPDAGQLRATLEEDLETLDSLLREKRIGPAASLLAEMALRRRGLKESAAADLTAAHCYAGAPEDTARVSRLLRRTEEMLDRCSALRSSMLAEFEQIRAQERFCDDGDPGSRGSWLSEKV